MEVVTKDELRQYRSIRAEIIELRREIEQMELLATAPKTQKLDTVGGAGGYDDAVSSVVSRLVSMKQMYLAKIACLLAIKEHIEIAVQRLTSEDRRLIRLHYFQGLSWEEVAVELCVSWRMVHYRHRDILERLGNYEQGRETESGAGEEERRGGISGEAERSGTPA